MDKNLRVIIATALFFAAQFTFSATLSESFNLNEFVTNYAMQHISHQDDETIKVTISTLDKNLSPPQCTTSITASLPPANAEVASTRSVAIHCTEPAWTIYVPIQVKILTKVIVTTHPIMPGDIISSDDLMYATHDKNQLHDGFFKQESEIIGMSVSRMLMAESILTKKNTKLPIIVKRNDAVTLTVKHSQIEISLLGIAKSDGRLHDVIKVQNPTSKKIVDAIVVGQNKADVTY